MAVRKKKTLLFTGRKKINVKLTMQLFSRGHHSKMHLTQDLFLQQVFSKAVVKTFLAKVCTLYDLSFYVIHNFPSVSFLYKKQWSALVLDRPF